MVGSTGFVGGHLRTGMVRGGWDVVTVDRSGSTGGDLVAVLEATLARSAPDVVVVCAGATAGSRHRLRRANVDLAGRLAGVVARARPRPRLVHLGSAAEYGAVSAPGPCREDAAAVPTTDYGWSKLAGTRAVLAAMPAAVVLRATTVIGPGCRGFLGSFCRQVALEGPQGVVHVGSLAAARDFVDVADLAAAVVAVAGAPTARPGVYNVGTGRAVPLGHVVERVRAITGFRGRVVSDAPSASTSAGIATQFSDVAKVRRAFGWTPSVPLDASIRATWERARADGLAGAEQVQAAGTVPG
ncbi:NAD(P)-dependent oxidoreductase [Isoptericola sp. 178]|uniref:NAD-dependent epimerase/dehydratase family protein n=1 Tax=Isoptericola sp. 178 TaxID=3064651 RepID=UPI0027122F3C|nr:NAD(P)-dependent oxidoreductase [Isoptericola sp. 178]MDO8143841.1 NAD(P)-dependent oxidoreductase [Isoptericola sp. 178]